MNQLVSIRFILHNVRAEARFFFVTWGGGIGGSGGILPPENFQFGGSETLFSALVMRYVSEKSMSNMKMANNCKSL